MGKGLDRAVPFTADQAKELAGHGYTFAGRYLSASAWKRLSVKETKALSDAGLYIVSIYQDANNDVSKFGRAEGARQARNAAVQARGIGQPKGTPIYFAVDFDANNELKLAAIGQFFDGVTDVLTDAGYTVGVYGSFHVVSYIRKSRPFVTYFFQTIAWSRGSRANDAHLFQKKCDTPLPERPGFGNVDLVDSNGAAGGWRLPK